MAKKPIIGIVGAVGSGKSTVAKILEKFGAKSICADQIAHEVLDRQDVLETLKSWWGESVEKDGKANCKNIREICKNSKNDLDKLESFVCPIVIGEIDHRTELILSDLIYKAIVWDIPLLVEYGMHGECDFLIFVESSFDNRLDRVQKNRKWEKDDLLFLDSQQENIETKRRLCTLFVENNGDEKYLTEQIRLLQLWDGFGTLCESSRG